MLSLNFTKFQSIYTQITKKIPKLQKNTHSVQIAPSHSIGMSEAQKINFAKHNEAHRNLCHDQ